MRGLRLTAAAYKVQIATAQVAESDCQCASTSIPTKSDQSISLWRKAMEMRGEGSGGVALRVERLTKFVQTLDAWLALLHLCSRDRDEEESLEALVDDMREAKEWADEALLALSLMRRPT